MFRSITLEERLQKAETTNRALRSQLDQTSARAAYMAMMRGGELPVAAGAGQDESMPEGGESDE